MHDLSLIATIAAGFTGAWILGLATQWLRLSPIVGYLLAGVVIGPHTPGFVGDVKIAHNLAEVGVILLMFGVGLHFHLKDLLAVKSVAIPGAIGQSLVATATAVVVFAAFGIPKESGAVIGMAMAVASTVVLMRVLMDADVLGSQEGHVAVGWLIVEDIFTVILLVLIPVLGHEVAARGSSESAIVGALALPTSPFATAPTVATTVAILSEAIGPPPPPLWQTLSMTLLKLSALVVIVLVVGPRVIPWMLVRVAKLRSRELFTLTVLVFSIAIAAGSYFFFGASMALGAFLAGMVVAQSPVSHQAAADALPMRDAFAVLFFVSVGMLFDPKFLIDQPLMVLAALGIILLAKPLAALVIVALLGHSARTALTVAIGLAQIGEFSFILSDLSRQYGLMDDNGYNVLVASAIISITLNPLLFRSLPKIEAWLRRRPRLWKLLNRRAERRSKIINRTATRALKNAAEPNERFAIVVGYGPVGRSVLRILRDAGLRTAVIDLNMDTVSSLNAEGQTAFFGDASNDRILEQAGVRRATHLVLTLPQAADRAAVVTAARNLNPTVRILVRARYLSEREDLERGGASAAVFEEAEAAVALARLVLADTGVHREAAERKIKDLRMQLIMENVSNIRAQRVRSVMVPWARVRRLLASADAKSVLALVSEERFSRWPVVNPKSGRTVGYLLTKDLIAQAADDDWKKRIRPLKAVHSNESIDSTLTRMQSEGASVYVVEDDERPVGLITLEDILEQVVGQIEDEYPREVKTSLAEAVKRGGIELDLTAATREDAIQQLAESIGRDALPPDVEPAQIARLALAREKELSTDLGNGIAIPHARCPGLAAPLVVFGRLTDGIPFSPSDTPPVRLVFLVVTPSEQPEVHLALLGQLAKVASQDGDRESLLRAESATDVLPILEEKVSGTFLGNRS